MKPPPWMTVLCLLGALTLSGCPKDGPVTPPPAQNLEPAKPVPIVKQLQDRKPVASCTNEELEARAQDDAAIGEVASTDAARVDQEIKSRWVKAWSKWSWISGFIGVGAGLVAFFLIAWYVKNLKMAAIVGGSLVGLGVLAFTFAQIMAHWQVLLWVGGVGLALAVIVFIWYLVDDHVRSLVDAVRVLGKDANVDGLRDRLADAQVHTADSLKSLLTRLVPSANSSPKEPAHDP